MKSILKPRTGIIAGMVLFAGVWRLIFLGNSLPLADFTPVGAMALFGGCYFSEKWKAYLVPLLTLWLSDLVLNYAVYFHHWVWFTPGFAWIYGSFALIVLMGTFIKKVSIRNVLVAGISSALLFWLISDFGVWVGISPYPKTFAGLTACYAAAIPFLRNMMFSNIIFSAIMFGAFEWAQKKYPMLAA